MNFFRIVFGIGFIYIGILSIIAIVGSITGFWDITLARYVWLGGAAVAVSIAAIVLGINILLDKDI